MKFFAFIIAFYILALSLAPCSDVRNVCNDDVSKTEFSQNHGHNQNQDDNCSPFCVCTCCSVSTIATDFKPFTFSEFSITQEVAIHNFTFISNFFRKIWQPHKLTTNC